MKRKTIRLTMAQALVRFLDAQYICADGQEEKFVRGVMGIFGHGNVVGLGQALEQYADRMPFIQGKNEQEIAHVCVAFAKQMRRRAIYACTASIGPGSLNMVTAAGTASVNRIPVLLLPSDAYADRQPDPVLQQFEHDEDYSITVNDAFKAVSRYWDRVQRPEQLMSAMLNAMRTLTDPARTGAVTVCIPQDVQGESYAYPEEFFEKRVWHLDRQPAAVDAVQRAAELLANSKRPMILSGGGVRYSDAGRAVLKFAEAFGVPVAETQAGKGEVDGNSGWYLGCAGICGTISANLTAKQADLILAVGTKLNDFVTNSKNGFARDARFVSINTSRMDALKLDAESVVADAREGMEALHRVLEMKGWHSAWKDEIGAAADKWQGERERLANLESPIPGIMNQTRVLMELNNMLADDNIVSASGSLPSDLERVWNVQRPGAYHLEYGFSCMGYEVSGALGVKLADPEREVYAFVGDGGFLMGHSDLLTSVQEGHKINVLLFNNSGHQCIHNLERSQGMGTFGTEFRFREEQTGGLTGGYVPVDYAKLASAYGVRTWRVTALDELRQAIAESRKSEVSTLIEIMVLPGTMTEGYENFWRVGTASVAEKESVRQAYEKLNSVVQTLRKY